MTAVIFDLDGTLIDSAPDIHAMANRVLAEEGLAPMTESQIRSFVGNGLPTLVARILAAQQQPASGAVHSHLVTRFATAYETAVELTTLYPNVAQALQTLAARGHRLGICTNKPLAPARAVLRHLGLIGFFPAILGGDSLPQRKPDPAPLQATLAALGNGPCLYVGDSEVDAETAAAAQIPFALFTEGYRRSPVETLPHAAAFTDFAQLPDIVTRILST